MTTIILIGIVSVLILAYTRTKKEWDNAAQPPKGWMNHKGFRQKLPKSD